MSEEKEIEVSKLNDLLDRLPFRLIIEKLVCFVEPYGDEFNVNVTKEGRLFTYKQGTESQNFQEDVQREYFTQSEFIKKIFGYFKKDPFRYPFLLFKSIAFNGTRFINRCTYSDYDITMLNDTVLLPIPRKIDRMELRSLQFADHNLPQGEKMEFLESVSVSNCNVRNFTSALSKFSSERLENLYFHTVQGNSDEEIDESFLPMLLQLKNLTFSKCDSLKEEIIERIVSFSEPNELEYFKLEFTKSRLDPLFKNYALRTKTLDLSSCQVTDQICEYISQNEHLEDLVMFSCEISTIGIISLMQSKSMKTLTIGENKIRFSDNDEELKQVKNHALQKLAICRNWRHPPENNFFLYLAKNVLGLKKLILYECEISDAHVESICMIRGLEHLNLDYNSVTRSKIQQFLNLDKLKFLNLCGCEDFNDEDMKVILQMKCLETFNISLSKVSDDSIDLLRGSKIKEINVHYTKMTKEGIEKLKTLPNIERFWYGFELGVGRQEYWSRNEDEERKYF